MIARFSDHAANERTFLAWVRTAIAIMAFGFLVEKFDLFLRVASRSLNTAAPAPGGQILGNIAGLLLITLGAATMILATVRFRRTARMIDSDATESQTDRMDVVLVGLMTVLGATLFVYLCYNVLIKIV